MSPEDLRTGTIGSPQYVRSIPGVIAAALFLLFGAITALAALPLGLWTPLGPGPGFFPFWTGLIVAAASATWGLAQWRRPNVVEHAATPEAAAAEVPATPRQIITTLVSLILLAVLLEVLGFQVSVLLFLVFQLKVVARRSWVLTIILSLAGSFGVYSLFSNVLSVPLPGAGIPFLYDLGL
ncbi:tripartite tricarboxylate transporter TctB family protein [Microbacterium sp. cf332]|uniref:tripartite tricarboxylate transporter TctB family protein n=1 Tax=Microbacterium sp. cf332 TaxID=1761804 RepID=UPI00159FFF08|nr:tripartite tricarboxylate transporter TctB family protein [Microbacterium sp. cf332]